MVKFNGNGFVFAHQPIVRSINRQAVAQELLLREFNGLNTAQFLAEPQLFCENLEGLVSGKAKTIRHLILNKAARNLFVNFTPE